ncbi:hypothetical protein LCGC14_2566500 [marine sediment metagenome]|uniref:YopX protein domain-containing protein n=1 Tax=marine sediment metagenome TaxID=412755 RepID=A0A0F9DBE5_9ZZZZ
MTNPRPYRAKPTDPTHAGEDGFVYGWYVEIGANKHYIISLDAKRQDTKTYETWDSLFALDEDYVTSVHPHTVGQDTGGEDKNHKKVYYNDEIKDDEGHVAIVKWCKKALGVCLEWDDGEITYPNRNYDYVDFVVIGTIHDKEQE